MEPEFTRAEGKGDDIPTLGRKEFGGRPAKAGGGSCDQNGLFHKVVSSFQLASAASEHTPLRRGSEEKKTKFSLRCPRLGLEAGGGGLREGKLRVDGPKSGKGEVSNNIGLKGNCGAL